MTDGVTVDGKMNERWGVTESILAEGPPKLEAGLLTSVSTEEILGSDQDVLLSETKDKLTCHRQKLIEESFFDTDDRTQWQVAQ